MCDVILLLEFLASYTEAVARLKFATTAVDLQDDKVTPLDTETLHELTY